MTDTLGIIIQRAASTTKPDVCSERMKIESHCWTVWAKAAAGDRPQTAGAANKMAAVQ